MITVELVTARVLGIRGVLDHEPEIWPDMTAASTGTIVALIFCLMERAPHTAHSIRSALQARGCTASFHKINSLLLVFEGSDPRAHLWERMSDGVFLPVWPRAWQLADDGFDDDIEPRGPAGTHTFL